jgi:hypothetical protein
MRELLFWPLDCPTVIAFGIRSTMWSKFAGQSTSCQAGGKDQSTSSDSAKVAAQPFSSPSQPVVTRCHNRHLSSNGRPSRRDEEISQCSVPITNVKSLASTPPVLRRVLVSSRDDRGGKNMDKSIKAQRGPSRRMSTRRIAAAIFKCRNEIPCIAQMRRSAFLRH